MAARIRRFVAVVSVLVLLVGLAAPVAAESDYEIRDQVSPTVDALVLRPVTFVTLVTGSVFFVAMSPFMLLSRPQDIGKPFDALVVQPAKYIWVDPLGTH